MALTYGVVHVNGPATIQIAFQTSFATYTPWQPFGITTAGGVDINNIVAYRNILDDAGGPDIEVDTMYTGIAAEFVLNLMVWNQNIADSLRAIVVGNTAGVSSYPGTLMVQDANSFKVLIDSAYENVPYQFKCCKLLSNNDPRSTVETVLRMPIRAWNGAGNNTTVAGLPVYVRTAM